VGNTVIDALYYILKKIEINKSNKKQILFTLHRRETQGKEMDDIFKALDGFIKRRPDIQFEVIKHHNPKVRESLENNFKIHSNCNVHESLPYSKFVGLMKSSDYIISDSGGIQEEATALGKILFLIRDFSERSSPWIIHSKSFNAFETFKGIEDFINRVKNISGFNRFERKDQFGNGNSSEIIIEDMIKQLF
jgi:UDP-N-acetylglucosamine 2-epimerase (non-hydrolysing)